MQILAKMTVKIKPTGEERAVDKYARRLYSAELETAVLILLTP